MAAKNSTIASVLAFEKKMVPSDGYMHGTTWSERNTGESKPLRLVEKSVRGTISNRLKAAIQKDPAKLNNEVEKANLQTVDACALAPDQDTLKLYYTLKFLGGVTEPSACNNDAFRKSYSTAARQYINEEGFDLLASLYAYNIASARFLWRNRIGAESIEVKVKLAAAEQTKEWSFDALNYALHEIKHHESLNELSSYIASVLASDDNHLLLEITCYAKLGNAQDVYPSEELILDKGKGNKSKVLYAVDNIAAMHSQKLGNALRTIDIWYPDYTDPDASIGPIAIEPYGSVTNMGKAFRTPKDKKDFYTLFDKWALGQELDSKEELHYVMAVLIRGGVFGQSDK